MPPVHIDFPQAKKKLMELKEREESLKKKQHDLNVDQFRSKNRINGILTKAKSPVLINAQGKTEFRSPLE